ncbi:MAG: hypothetical protein JO302_00875 [Candidatus Eremiobacteraeota bacterium]|nr:hypothetical protein [Candidatus Eremiobacteraeota bacterium]
MTFAGFVACSGGQNPVPLPSSAMTAQRATLTLRIHIPKRRAHRARRGIRPRYVSPATAAMTLAIAGPTTLNTTVALTPTSNGCSSSLAGTTCQLTLSLRPCATNNCYTATIVTYDAVSCSGSSCSIPPSANKLSGAQNVPFMIHAGQNNVTNLTLGGIPATVTVTPLLPGYLRGDAQRLQLWGAAPQKLDVLALDADGNAIVGPGSPALLASSSSPTLKVTVGSGAPNTLVLSAATSGSPAVVTPGSVKLSITVAPQSDSGGSPISLTVPVAIAHSALYVGLTTSAIAIYYDGNRTTPNLTISGGSTMLDGTGIDQFAVDGNGTLYLAQDSEILEWPAGTNGDVAPSVTISGATTTMDMAAGIAVGPNGAMYVSNFGNNSITEFAQGASGDVAPVNTISGGATGLNFPDRDALDAAGTLYVVDRAGNSVVEFQSGASGNASPSATISGSNPNLSLPISVAVDGSGALYVGDATPQIAEFAPGASGNAVSVARISGGMTDLGGGAVVAIAADAAGTIYASTNATPRVVEYAPGSSGNVAPAATISLSATAYALYAVPAPNINVLTP